MQKGRKVYIPGVEAPEMDVMRAMKRVRCYAVQLAQKFRDAETD